MGSAPTFVVLFLALLSPFFYERSRILSMFYNNSPLRLARVNAFQSHEVKFEDRIRNCEDSLLLEDHGIALITCDAGRERWNTVMGIFQPGPVVSADIFAYDYASSGKSDAEALKKIELVGFAGADDFHTLGMAYNDKTSTLYVSNHAKAGSRIEVFNLNIKTLKATHTGTIKHPLIHGPNGIALINDNEFYVTNDHHFTMKQSQLLANLETYLAPALGTVVHVNLTGGNVQAKVVARMPYANGIDILNSTTVAVASTSRGAVYLYTRGEEGLTYHSQIFVPFFPDNLSSSEGKLLIAGHAHAPTTTSFAKSRYICMDPETLAQSSPEVQTMCKDSVATSWVSEWQEGGELKHLYVDTEFPSTSTALWDAKRAIGIISGLYAKGIMIWKL